MFCILMGAGVVFVHLSKMIKGVLKPVYFSERKLSLNKLFQQILKLCLQKQA